MDKQELLKAMAFVTLTQGMEGVAPNYVLEKWNSCKNISGEDTFSLLGPKNQQRLINWGKIWDVDVKELVSIPSD